MVDPPRGEEESRMDDEQDDDNARTVVPARHVPSVPAGLQDATIPIVLLVLEWINGNEILWRHQTPIPRVAAAVVVAIIMVMMMMVTALPGTEDVSNGLDRPSCRAGPTKDTMAACPLSA